MRLLAKRFTLPQHMHIHDIVEDWAVRTPMHRCLSPLGVFRSPTAVYTGILTTWCRGYVFWSRL